MASRFAVDLDRMQAVTDRMARFDTALDVHLGELDAELARLHATWSGDAARAQHDAHEEWMNAARRMRAALATMQAIATTAHGNYQAAAAANVRMWQDVAP